MVRKLTALFEDHEDVLYAIEHYERRDWGIRCRFYSDTSGIISMMVYGACKTESELQNVVNRLESAA